MCNLCMPCAHGVQKQASEDLDLELWLLRTKSIPLSVRTTSILNVMPCHQLLVYLLKLKFPFFSGMVFKRILSYNRLRCHLPLRDWYKGQSINLCTSSESVINSVLLAISGAFTRGCWLPHRLVVLTVS